MHGQREKFRATLSFARLKNLGLAFSSYSAAVHLAFPPSREVKQQFAMRGSGQITFGRSLFHISANETCALPADTETTVDLGENYAQFVLRFDARALQTKLATLVDRPAIGNIEFLPPDTSENPRVQRLRRLVSILASELDCEEGDTPDLALVEFEQVLMISFLTANAHNYSHLLEDRSPSAAPWQVRVVEEYLAAHWSRPITIEALAEATGVGIRSMFKTFRDARGCSPMSFLKHTRLQHARRMLQASDEGTSVTGVGFSCGFDSLGHFAREYREAFSELPSATLARARGTRRSRASS